MIDSALPRVHAALLDALGVLLPVECAGCDRPDRALCDACRRELRPRLVRRALPGGLRVLAGADYDGVLRRAILAFKDGDRTELASPLAELLAAALRECLASVPPGRVELCPVPPSRRSWHRRGYDPVRMLTRHAGVRAPRLLRAARRGGAQHGGAQKALGVDARAANAAGSLRARRPLLGRRVILVDDVVTSGATLEEAARAVRAAGGEVLAAVAVASTPRRNRRGRTLADDGQ